jgi:EmrB/QacA subfamily drug resistance transporter
MTASAASIHTHKHIPRILGVGLFLQQLDAMILNTAIPQMAKALGASPLSLKLAITTYLLSLAMFIPISGYIADRFGSQRTFSMAMWVFLLGSLMSGLAHNVEILILGRLVQGVGAAMVMPVGRLILLKTFSRSDFLVAFTAYTMIGQIGLVAGPILGGILTTFVGWRYIFFVNIPVILMTLYWGRAHIPNYQEVELPKFDWLGFFSFGIAAGGVTLALSWMTEDSFQHLELPLICLVCGLSLGVFYYLHARQSASPSLDLNVFRIRTFRIATLGGFLFRVAIGGSGFILPLQMQVLWGYSAFQSGLMLVPNVLAFMATKTVFRFLVQRYGFKKPLFMAPWMIVLVFFALAFVTASTPLWLMALLMAILGFFSSFQYSLMNTLNLADVPVRESSRATSVSVVFQQLGLSFAVCLCAGLLVASSAITHAAVMGPQAFHDAYLALGVLTALCVSVFRGIMDTDGRNLLR